jgi:glutamyl-Q tRNA(Asp) synthetase
VSNIDIAFDDRIAGPRKQNLAADVGDFVLLRADGYFAYQLAVVVDDAAQGITDVVRGADLIDSTPRQIHLAKCLDLRPLRYAHLPVVMNAKGEKLSKQTQAPAIDISRAPQLLCDAFRFLGMSPPGDLQRLSLAEVWAWAQSAWLVSSVASGAIATPAARMTT